MNHIFPPPHLAHGFIRGLMSFAAISMLIASCLMYSGCKEMSMDERSAHLDNSANTIGENEIPTKQALVDSVMRAILSSPEKVTRLDLSYGTLGVGGLDELLVEICNLPNLQYLDLSGNPIKTIPPEIERLQKLDTLILSHNDEIHELPDEMVKLKNLKHLSIQVSNFNHIPPVIFELEGLQSLDVMKTQITEIPSDISKLKNLKTLLVNNNKIRKLPKEIGQLENLETLWIINTHITDLPDEISNLKKLKYLWVFPSPKFKSRIDSLCPNVKLESGFD